MNLKLDFLDVFADACGSLIGRILLTALAISIGGAIGVAIAAEDLGLVVHAFAAVFPLLLASIFHATGLLVIPLLFGFTILFCRLELKMRYLIFPAVITLFTLYGVTKATIEKNRRMNEKLFGHSE